MKTLQKHTDTSIKKIEKILEYLGEGATIEKACELAGASRGLFYTWKNAKKEFF